ncbi:MAG: hypothetical protein MZV63_60470 [Marinilabiliales bacterium]|nr:hypothetical protein [Marinilabiliales bacterium]
MEKVTGSLGNFTRVEVKVGDGQEAIMTCPAGAVLVAAGYEVLPAKGGENWAMDDPGSRSSLLQ